MQIGSVGSKNPLNFHTDSETVKFLYSKGLLIYFPESKIMCIYSSSCEGTYSQSKKKVS